jgi:squalene-hopene/tetraprenyl-beta-curcumene cyclase
MTYLIARPALRRMMGEKEPTKHETTLLSRLRSNVGAKPAAALRDVEVIFAALFLAMNEPDGRTMSADTQKAFDQLWTLQGSEGMYAGAWKWYQANLDPWEMPESSFFGASLAALAVGITPPEYRARPEVQANIKRLSQYLESGLPTQTLHNRLTLLWASSKLPEAIAASSRRAIVEEIFKLQNADGSWAIAALGPWQPHENAPAAGANPGYATSFISYVLVQAGTDKRDARLRRALDWLRTHQDPASGTWGADSLNKAYPSGSMEQSFMRDAATAFAAAALAGVS